MICSLEMAKMLNLFGIDSQRSLSIAPTNPTDSKGTSAKSPLIRTQSEARFAFLTSLRERRLTYRSEDIDKIEGRRRSIMLKERRPIRFDEGSLHLINDPSASIYRRLNETLQNKTPTDGALLAEQEKLKFCEKYGPELLEFMKDRKGNLKSKYDKTFII